MTLKNAGIHGIRETAFMEKAVNHIGAENHKKNASKMDIINLKEDGFFLL
jgi:hypothetical protein